MSNEIIREYLLKAIMAERENDELKAEIERLKRKLSEAHRVNDKLHHKIHDVTIQLLEAKGIAK